MYFDYGFNGVAGFTLNNKTYVYKKNIQNDIISIFDNNGQEIAKYHYDAWGNHTIEIWNGQKFVDISEVSSDNDYRKVAEINPFRYRSYYYDTETDLYYLNSRYYDPELCRFINADDISVIDITKDSINGLNLFSYCLNNPVNNIDENGNLPKWFYWILSVAAVVVGTVLVATGAGAAFGGALIAAGVGSIINGYVNETNGDSFDNGWLGGFATGFFCGLGAGLGGNLLITATKITGIGSIFALGSSIVTSFFFGALGNTLGSWVTSKMDNKPFNFSTTILDSIFLGALNILAGFGSGTAGTIFKAGAAAAYKGLSYIVSSITEFIFDAVSYIYSEVIKKFIKI